MKALHPSDHEIKASRIPGGNCLSVAVCADQVSTVPLTSANSEVGITLIPNPIIPCSMIVTSGGVTTNYQFCNPAFSGTVLQNGRQTDIRPFIQNFAERVENYRITSESVTVELIAPTLSDQGTVTAAQFSSPPKTVSTAYGDYDTQTVPTNAHICVGSDVWLYEAPPQLDSLVLGTQAYTSKAREGCYMPLKLTNFKWKRANDAVLYYQVTGEEALRSVHTLQCSDSTGWPFYVTNNASTMSAIYPLPKNCGSNFGLIGIQGTAANVAVRVRVRQVIELTCRPSTTYAPLLEVPLPPDEMALKMYFEISARMADAYPASYNDLGKLKSFISGIAKKISPFVDPALSYLSKLPGPVGTIASGAKTVLPVVRAVLSKKR